jgi:YD repeat-containing protein
VRSFVYNGLSQLVTSTNPETGTICYGTWNGTNCANAYDANGNLGAKTDASGITTSYRYDPLNRLISAVYSNDSALTPSSCYFYDGSATNNAVGRLVQEWTQPYNTTCPSTPPVSGTGVLTGSLFTAYDAVGRLLSSQQCVLTMCASGGTSFQLSRIYDLAGNPTRVTETGIAAAVPQLQLSSNYDGAGRLSNMQSNWDGAPQSTDPLNIFSVQSYSPAGLQSWTLGNYLNFQKTYDARDRPISEVVNHP